MGEIKKYLLYDVCSSIIFINKKGGSHMAKCYWCDGTGKFKKPRNQESYSESFDRLDAPGVLSAEQCRERALEEVGYDIVKCKYCNGTGVESK